MKMPSYLENWTVAYGRLVELDVDSMAATPCTPGWGITVIAKMPQKGIIMKMKLGVNFG
jgi:hypothetical protein